MRGAHRSAGAHGEATINENETQMVRLCSPQAFLIRPDTPDLS